ncbi:hypothetical protein QQS21_006943 [Conoideocrella luteorostrata]|uniref:Heat-labile enterotoxin IIA, A chain n=1 Tax=Conoideocrella luteorostrata TaxID=1105319 RepID=A0AAJ0CLP0_9HYPO|nr:hypothetical protein QQS21_006943 [Conoideocrella luteorostrata]
MKPTAVYLAILLGLATASPAVHHTHALQRRARYIERPPGPQIGSTIKDGLGNVGLNGDLGPNRLWTLFGTPGVPLTGMSEISSSGSRKPAKPESDGSHVAGPKKKPDRIYRWPKEGANVYTHPSQVPQKAATGTRFPSGPHGFRIKGHAGKALAFEILSPYAHDLLNAVKKMDNPVGWAVSWFDNAMSDLQTAIGGEQVASIHGNKLKLRLICWLRGDQPHPLLVDEDCERLKAEDKAKEKQEEEARKDADCSNVSFGPKVPQAYVDHFLKYCEGREKEKQKHEILEAMKSRIRQDIDHEEAWEKEKKQADPSGRCFQGEKEGSQNATSTRDESCKVLEAEAQTKLDEKRIGGLNGLFEVCDDSLGLEPTNCGAICLFEPTEKNHRTGSITDTSLRKKVLDLCESLRDESEKQGLQG